MVEAIVRAVVVLALALASARAGAEVTSVRLHAGARVEGPGPVTLAQVAEVTGPQAALLAPLVVIEDFAAAAAKGHAVVGIEQVRAAVLGVEGVVQGRLMVAGVSCVVAPARAGVKAPAAPARPAAPGVPEHLTLRARVVEHLRALFGASPETLRVGFDDRDADLLAGSVDALTVEIRSLGGSDRMPLAITTYDGDRVVTNTTIRVGVQVLRPVAVATAQLPRGKPVAAGDVATQERWVEATARPVPPGEVVGRVTKSRVNPGEVLDADDLARPVHVERGSLASIRSVVGTAVVRTRARALGDGSEGEVVEFESLDRATKFLARVAGPGQAVVAPVTPGAGR